MYLLIALHICIYIYIYSICIFIGTSSTSHLILTAETPRSPPMTCPVKPRQFMRFVETAPPVVSRFHRNENRFRCGTGFPGKTVRGRRTTPKKRWWRYSMPRHSIMSVWFHFFLKFPPLPGEINTFLTNIIRMGWNHQLVVFSYMKTFKKFSFAGLDLNHLHGITVYLVDGNLSEIICPQKIG